MKRLFLLKEERRIDLYFNDIYALKKIWDIVGDEAVFQGAEGVS